MGAIVPVESSARPEEVLPRHRQAQRTILDRPRRSKTVRDSWHTISSFGGYRFQVPVGCQFHLLAPERFPADQQITTVRTQVDDLSLMG